MTAERGPTPRPFRQRLLLAAVVATIVPALALATPLIERLTDALRRDAAEHLESEAQRLAARVDRQVELIATRAAAVAQDSDVRRAARVPIFLSKADSILRDFRRGNPEVAQVFYLDGDGTPITAQPAGLDLRLADGDRRQLTALAAVPVREGAAFVVIDAPTDAPSLPSDPSPAAAIPGGGAAPAVLAVRVPVRTIPDHGVPASLVVLVPWSALLPQPPDGDGVAIARRGDASPVAATGAASGAATGAATGAGSGAATGAGSGAATGAGSSAGSGAAPSAAPYYSVSVPLLAESSLAVGGGAPGAPAFHMTLAAPAPRLFHAATQAWRVLWLTLGGGILFLALVALVLAHRLVRPLDTVHAFVAEYARGNYRATPPHVAGSELDAIVGTLTAMGARVLADMEATERRAASETALIQAELDTLKNQMKPHFLFNALNNIAAMAHDHADETVPMLNKVASLYRLILASSRSVTQPMTAELEVVRHYLDLEGLRLKERLTYRIDAAGVDTATPVPCLLLQTLVENSVKHGIAPSLEGGRILLTLANAAGGGLDVTLLNTGEPLDPGFVPGTGLTNTIRRLELLYPGRHRFDLTTAADGATVARFWLGPSKV